MHNTIFEQTFAAIPILSTLKEDGVIDLVILTGSYIARTHDAQSDIDLFVVVPLQAEEHYALAAEYTHQLLVDGIVRKIEVSFVATEKLVRDQHAKTHIFWWHNAVVLFSKNKKILTMFNKASSYSSAEWLDALWTLNFQFKLGVYDYEKIVVRRPQDIVGTDIVYNDTLKIFLNFMVLSRKTIVRFTSFTREFAETEPEILSYLQSVSSESASRRKALEHCNDILEMRLHEIGFKKEEIENWTQHGLSRLTFQKY